MPGKGTAIYIAAGHPLKRRAAKSFMSFFISLIAVFSILGANIGAGIAFADDDGGQSKLEDAAKDYGVETGQEGFGKTMDKYEEKDSKTISETDGTYTFAHVIKRVFDTRYLNYTPEATAGDGADNRDWNCDVNNKFAGTPLYHNCDVPNMMTQFLQNFIQGASPMGFVGATVANARSDTELGIPSNLPGGRVPPTYATGSAKYTGLEILGYNLHYTSYKGEWDFINVSTSARLLSNFGLMDSISIGVNLAVNGTVNGAKVAASQSLDSLKQGDVLGAMGNLWSGFAEGAASGVIRVLLDSSDLNVFNTNAWYRVNYGGTVYNARELTQSELADRMQIAFSMMIKGTPPDKAQVPDDYLKIKAGPPKPKEAISKCTDDKKKVIGSVKTAPGISQKDCKDKGGKSWTKDGAQKQETLAAWNTANKSYFDTAKKYGLECKLDSTDEKKRQATLDSFFACWSAEWPKQQGNAAASQQGESNQSWLNNLLGEKAVYAWFKKNPDYNINSPWRRFVCLDANGRTMYQGGKNWDYEFVYDKNGKVNSKCKALRPPIQNGYFGNGYMPGGKGAPNQSVQPDTRYNLVDQASFLSFLFDSSAVSNTIANALLSVTSLEARIANTVLDFSFSPIVQKVGLDKTVVDFIEEFRDGVYFPLLVLVIMFSAITVLINAGRNKNYVEGLKSAFLMIITAFLGILILFKPDFIVKVVDSGPAQVETAVAGAIFSFGNDDTDTICEATQSSADGPDELAKSFIPSDAVRTMECQIWRVMVYNPYVYGQWGTHGNNLWANTTQAPNKMHNANTRLVGDASVAMGGGKTVKNWGFYQAKVLSSGTITTDDPLINTGQAGGNYTLSNVNTVPRDIYRLVDLQAGPKNGAGTDSRYFEQWAGRNPSQRIISTALSMVTGAFAMVAIVLYGFAKIEITIISMIMLLFLPLILLLGIHPTFGRVKLKQYIGTIVALMIQRVALVAILAVMISLLSSLALASTDVLTTTIIVIALCAFFIAQRKKLMSSLGADVSKGFGGSITGSKSPKEALMAAVPQSMQNMADQRRAHAKGMVHGAAAGFLMNGTSGIITGAAKAGKTAQNRNMNHLRLTGQLGAVTNIQNSMQAGKNAAQSEVKMAAKRLKNSELHSSTASKLNAKHRELEVERITNEEQKKNPSQVIKKEDIITQKLQVDLDDDFVTKQFIELEKLLQQKETLEADRDNKKNIKGMPTKKPAPGDKEAWTRATQAVQEHNRHYNERIAEVDRQYDAAFNKLYTHVAQNQPDTEYDFGSKDYRIAELRKMKEALEKSGRAWRNEPLEKNSDSETPVLEEGQQ